MIKVGISKIYPGKTAPQHGDSEQWSGTPDWTICRIHSNDRRTDSRTRVYCDDEALYNQKQECSQSLTLNHIRNWSGLVPKFNFNCPGMHGRTVHRKLC